MSGVGPWQETNLAFQQFILNFVTVYVFMSDNQSCIQRQVLDHTDVLFYSWPGRKFDDNKKWR